MASNFQPISVPFKRGIDTKSDEKAVSPPYCVALENGVFTKAGTISKRNGYTELSTQTTTGASITSGTALVAHDDELLVFDDSNCYSYSQALSKWVPKGVARSVGVSATDVIRNAYTQTAPDSAISGSVAVYAWLDGRGGIRASVQDTQTGGFFAADVSLNTTTTYGPRCVVAGAYLFVMYPDGAGNIRLSRVNTASPTSFDIVDKIVIANAHAATPTWDATAFSSAAFVVWYQNNANTMTLAYITAGGYLGLAGNGYAAPMVVSTNTGSLADAAAVVSNGTLIYLGWHNTTTGLNSYVTAGDFTTHAWAVQGNLDTTAAVNSLGGVLNGTSLTWFLERTTAVVRQVSQDASAGGVSSAAANFLTRVGLASKPFVNAGTVFVVVVLYQGITVQPTYFVASADGVLVSKHLYAEGYAGSFPNLAAVLSLGSGEFSWAATRKGKLDSVNGNVYTVTGVTNLGLDFQQVGRFGTAQMGEETHVTGGVLASYDGSQLLEHGFLYFPEPVNLTSVAGAGGSIADGTYLYKVVYEWQDNRGQMHRSAGSSPLTVAVAAGTGTAAVTINIGCLALTNKTGVVLAVYRTTNNGTIYYKVSSLTSPTINNPAGATAGMQAFVDTLADASITGNEILYTVGGELDNDPPPAASIVAASKRRVFLAGTEDPNALWYSKSHVYGEGVSFSAGLTKSISPTGGPITAVACMDDKVVIFKASTLLYFSGDGPTATGLNDTFTDVVTIASDVGCTNPASIVQTSEGLMFQSGKGIYLLSRSLEVSYAGAAVDAYNSQTVSAAVLLGSVNQVRFACSDGNALVYNYFFKAPFPADDPTDNEGQWSVFTNYAAAGACLWQGNFAFLRSNGKVCVESAGFTDGSAAISMRIKTGWFKFPLPGGFSRVAEALVMGVYKSPHMLAINVAYDFQTYPTQSLSLSPQALLAVSTWGGDVSWGGYSTWGGVGDQTYQFRSRLPTQECEAVQFEFVDSFSASQTAGEGYALNALTLLVEPQPGLARLSPARTM